MKYAFTAVALIAAVSAQDMSGIPACAVPCIQSAAATTSCSATDYKCICNDVDAIQGAASSCVMDKCGATVAVCKSHTPLPPTPLFRVNAPTQTTNNLLLAAIAQVLPAVKDFCTKVAAAPAPAAPSMSEAEHPAPAAPTEDCTESMAPTPLFSQAPAPAPTTSECTTTDSAPTTLITAASSSAPASYPVEAMSSSSPAEDVSSSSVCEQEPETETSTYAAVTAASSSSPAAAAATGTYGSSPYGTTPLVQPGGNYSTGVATHAPPVATAAAATAAAGSVGALAVLVLGALAI
ncbi:uncharacterized protein PG986_004393 [Apiospora aurea]|uniref:CFEM domain-containing protein n=1 Tax=Apiospora aurea TaxID=335848 RepID=A0ABR1QMG8_9PEZI